MQCNNEMWFLVEDILQQQHIKLYCWINCTMKLSCSSPTLCQHILRFLVFFFVFLLRTISCLKNMLCTKNADDLVPTYELSTESSLMCTAHILRQITGEGITDRLWHCLFPVSASVSTVHITAFPAKICQHSYSLSISVTVSHSPSQSHAVTACMSLWALYACYIQTVTLKLFGDTGIQ